MKSKTEDKVDVHDKHASPLVRILERMICFPFVELTLGILRIDGTKERSETRSC